MKMFFIKMTFFPILLFIVTCHSNAYAGLIASYSFEGNLLDSSGFGNHGGVLSGNTALGFSPGIFGQAVSFNGTGRFDSGRAIRVAHSNSLNLSSAMTLSAWINPAESSASNTGIIFKGDLNFSFGAYDLLIERFRPPNTGIRTNQAASLLGNGPVEALSPTQTITFGKWQHLASTFDGSVLRVFINGVEVASTPFVGTITQEVSPLWIGQRFDPRGPYVGLIDEVRIYDTALSSSEIAALAKFPGSPPAVPEPSSLVLLGIGAVGLLGFRRRRKPKQVVSQRDDHS